jgi:hypothetical protein
VTLTDAVFALFFGLVAVWVGHHIAAALARPPLEVLL